MRFCFHLWTKRSSIFLKLALKFICLNIKKISVIGASDEGFSFFKPLVVFFVLSFYFDHVLQINKVVYLVFFSKFSLLSVNLNNKGSSTSFFFVQVSYKVYELVLVAFHRFFINKAFFFRWYGLVCCAFNIWLLVLIPHWFNTLVSALVLC
jgi:hypothetical protein